MNDISHDFRAAMRRMIATVNIITVVEDGVAHGMTATAVSSLSTDPASLLICVNQSASMHGVLEQASHFCVNMLHQDQIDLARQFSDSSQRAARFTTGGWETETGLPPRLPDAQASILCRLSQTIAFATHSICIGTVIDVRVREDVGPLAYLDGAFSIR
jgi:flavin reductase